MLGRICVVVVVGAALLVATFSKDALVLLGGLAVAFGFQMWVPLAAVCYFPWLTREGVSWGLLAGIVGVMLTESIGQQLFGDTFFLGEDGLGQCTLHSGVCSFN